MLITESQMGFGYGGRANAQSILNNLVYIQESISPSLVPVLESNTRGQHIVDLNSLLSFQESSGINDLGYALQLVCESNSITTDSVVFSVQEESIIEDSSIASLCESMLNNGILVYAKPLSKYDTVSLVGEACMDEAYLYGDWSLLEAFSSGDWGVLLEKMSGSDYNVVKAQLKPIMDNPSISIAAKNTITRELERMKNDPTQTYYDHQAKAIIDAAIRSQPNVQKALSDNEKWYEEREQAREKRIQGHIASPIDLSASDPSLTDADRERIAKEREENRATIDGSKQQKVNLRAPGRDKRTTKQLLTEPSTNSDGKDVKPTTDNGQLEEKIKELQYKGMNAPRRYLSKIIAWFHRKAAEYNNKLHNTGMKDGKIPWYKKILSYITRAIESLTRRLHNTVSDKDNQLKEYDRSWDFKKKEETSAENK